MCVCVFILRVHDTTAGGWMRGGGVVFNTVLTRSKPEFFCGGVHVSQLLLADATAAKSPGYSYENMWLEDRRCAFSRGFFSESLNKVAVRKEGQGHALYILWIQFLCSCAFGSVRERCFLARGLMRLWLLAGFLAVSGLGYRREEIVFMAMASELFGLVPMDGTFSRGEWWPVVYK